MTRAEEIREITPVVFAWQAYEPAVKCDLSSCAIATGAGLVVVDPIEVAEPALARLLASHPPLAVVLTNVNHTRAAAAFRERLRVPVYAAADAAGLEITPDILLGDGADFPGGMKVMALPGAGPGEMALFGNGIVCIGDALIHLPPHGLRLLPEKYCEDAALLRASLRKLLSCDAGVMTFAHGAPLIGPAREHLEPLLA